MSVISKDLAGQIAYKLTEKSKAVVDKLHVAYREMVTEYYEKQTPKDVIACHKKHPEWLQTRSSIYFEGHGFRWEDVTATRPVINNSRDRPKLALTPAIAAKLQAAKNKWQVAKEKYERLKDESKQALIALKTYANIRKELPEAAPFLPPPVSNALVVNFTGLKKQLAAQPVDTVKA